MFKKFINGIKVNFDEDRIYFNDLRKFINRNFKNENVIDLRISNYIITSNE